MPCPRSVTTVPGWVPAATSSSSSPSSVGTVTVVPRAAAGADTSTTVTRSLPSRRKRSSCRHADEHVDVAGRTAALAGVAAAGQPDPLLIGDAGRNVDRERLADGLAPAPRARLAGMRGDLALAVTDVAGLLADELAEGRARDRAQPARPRRSASRSRSACPAPPVAVTALAGVHQVVGHLHGVSARGLLERDLHLHAHVAALHAPGAAAERPGERVATAEEGVEDVGEGAEAVCRGGEATGLEPLEAVPVVGGPALGVGQDLVGLRGLLELLLGLRVVAVHVRVELAGERAERLLHRALVGVATHAQHLIRVAPHSSYTSATKRDSSEAAWRTAMITRG